jgi:hypothetical protein
MASAKHHLSFPGAPSMRRAGATVANTVANKDHGRLMPWLMLAAALLAIGTASRDAGVMAPAVSAPGTAPVRDGDQTALIVHTPTRAALADAVGGF